MMGWTSKTLRLCKRLPETWALVEVCERGGDLKVLPPRKKGWRRSQDTRRLSVPPFPWILGPTLWVSCAQGRGSGEANREG